MRAAVSFIAKETDSVEIIEAVDMYDMVYLEHADVYYALYLSGDEGVIEKRYRIDGNYVTLNTYKGRLEFAYAIYRLIKQTKYE
jgi:hypothetical protein